MTLLHENPIRISSYLYDTQKSFNANLFAALKGEYTGGVDGEFLDLSSCFVRKFAEHLPPHHTHDMVVQYGYRTRSLSWITGDIVRVK